MQKVGLVVLINGYGTMQLCIYRPCLFFVCFAVVEYSSIYTVVGFTLSETRALSAPEKGAGPMALMLWLEWVT
jgi:hypothetical protein